MIYSDSARDILKNQASTVNVGGKLYARFPKKNQWKIVGALHADITVTKDSFGNLSQSLDSTVNLEENPMTALITLAQQDSDGNAITWTFSEDGERNNITAITGTGYN